jgi:hypothetical protein
MSTSFPYLEISRRLTVPYAEVLKLADHIETCGPFDPVCHDKLVYCFVEEAVIQEQCRRAWVVNASN